MQYRWAALSLARLDGIEHTPFLRHGFFLFAWTAGSLAQDLQGQPGLLLRMLFDVRTTRPLNGLIWPKDGCASIA
jgi:hypothetical protein